VSIDVKGIEGQALNADSYLKTWRSRVFAGLCVSEVVMGDASQSNRSTSDTLTEGMHETAQTFQKVISETINKEIIFRWLLEGGFDPISKEDEAFFAYNTIEIDVQIKKSNQVLQEWLMDATTEDEMRHALGRDPLTTATRAKTHTNLYPAMDKSAQVGTIDNKTRPEGRYGKKPSPDGKVGVGQPKVNT
jgi:hypothetical protein